MDEVVFISNPFGFGPTGRVIVLMEELANCWGGKIVYVASKKCQEILTEPLRRRVQVIELNERDEHELRDCLLQHKTALVVVSLNRVAVKTAKLLGRKVLFVDSLAWMWKEIPQEYLLADVYYYYNIFGAQEKFIGINNSIPIAPILGKLPPVFSQRSRQSVIHIGGFSNPFTNELLESYLKILAEALRKSNPTNSILITGGRSAIHFLSAETGPIPHIDFRTLGRDEFVRAVAGAERLVTTPGSTATLEAFALETPIAFMLPTNLSQWKQITLFAQEGAAPLKMLWETYLSLDSNFNMLTEQEAVHEFKILSDRLWQDDTLKERVVSDINHLLIDPINLTGQKDFIQKVGLNGSSIIVADILKLVTSVGN